MSTLTRAEQLRSLVDANGFGLEIGPSHNPVFPRREGFNVEALDWTTTEQLVAKYESMGEDTSRIETVDYVSSGRPIDEVIGRRHEYDFVFSSHAIEHVTDFVGYLKSCEALLKPGGKVVMAVPDKRYTFDALQQVSTTGRVLEAYHRRQQRHSPAAVYDFIANYARLGGRDVWGRGDIGPVETIHAIQGADHLLRETMAPDGPYHDVHGWNFTPSSFRLLLHDLKALGIVALDEYHMHVVESLEFHVGLSAGAPGHGLDRLTLLKNVVREQVISGMQLLAEDDPAIRQMFETLR